MSEGGKGGDARVGRDGVGIGGQGGDGGVGAGIAGRGGDAQVQGDGLARGGDGGNAGTPDGRGGRGARGPGEAMGHRTEYWRFGAGGAGANHPEYERRLQLLIASCRDYCTMFPDRARYIEAQIDRVPISWTNLWLQERGENWRVELGLEGYVLPALPGLK